MTSTLPDITPSHGAIRAKYAVFLTFFLCGFVFASWAARIPLVMSIFSINSAQMGLFFLCAAAGSLTALIIAGWITSRFSSAFTVMLSALVFSLGMGSVAVSALLPSQWLLGGGLFIFGFGFSLCDVAMNLEGTQVEQRLGYTIMPKLHACFSFGTVTGAACGALLEFLQVGFTLPLLLLVIGAAVLLLWCSSRYLSAGTRYHAVEHTENQPRSNPFAAWLEWRTLAIGFTVLATSLLEGAAFDWLPLGVVTGFTLDGVEPAGWMGSMTLALFVAAMTSMRWFGGLLIDKYGRVVVLRVCTVLSITGLMIFGFSPNLSMALPGILLWGIGCALGFPVGMSAAADEPRHAASRIAVVAAIGYCSLLTGPPLLGFLANAFGVKNALLLLVIPLCISLLLVSKLGVVAPVKEATDEG
ncbi:MFS transporter [Budviciaceae bacterium CWB-B4]|uniref:MFS transporter n=1 Tax=Limnobaculum xujianqingii TaxID=2738837 RepID=A0A9D7AJX0_9GAMM|nr:MFS transporter [Limnobaculum xujianqingii]MBK5074245.1 MFS transporter [Limnobaculum xujianqingii]MBK5177554.1 MFS transporter [Limnobaculum xujianqingii]